MNDIQKIYCELREIISNEEKRLWRMARNAKAHDCSYELFEAIQKEAWELYRMDADSLLERVEKHIFFRFAFGGTAGNWTI